MTSGSGRVLARRANNMGAVLASGTHRDVQAPGCHSHPAAAKLPQPRGSPHLAQLGPPVAGSRFDQDRGGALALDVVRDASRPVAAADEYPGFDVVAGCFEAEVCAGKEDGVIVRDRDLGVQ